MSNRDAYEQLLRQNESNPGNEGVVASEVFDNIEAQKFLEKNPFGYAWESSYSGGSLIIRPTETHKIGMTTVQEVWEEKDGSKRKIGYTLVPEMAISYLKKSLLEGEGIGDNLEKDRFVA
jgi:hypothetical protein